MFNRENQDSVGKKVQVDENKSKGRIASCEILNFIIKVLDFKDNRKPFKFLRGMLRVEVYKI
jgi:hypothetical protein